MTDILCRRPTPSAVNDQDKQILTLARKVTEHLFASQAEMYANSFSTKMLWLLWYQGISFITTESKSVCLRSLAEDNCP